MKYPAFIGGSYQSKAFTADCERSINWFPELLESEGATSRAILLPTPGVEILETAAVLGRTPFHQFPGRAHFAMNGREFAVVGNNLYEFNEIGRKTDLGEVEFDGSPATICSNGDGGGELFITSGGKGYIFDLTTSDLTEITALSGKATMGDTLDGYFLCLDASTSTLYSSNLLDGLTWDTGEDFAQRSLQPDRWLAMKVSGRLIWLFGEYTSEAWYDTGATFPFAPHPSGVLNYGIAAPWSAQLMGSDLVWMAQDRSGRRCVLRTSGFTPGVISTYPLEGTLQSYDSVTDVIGDVYSMDGHTFYLLHCDQQDVTWVWDAATQMWHERGTWIHEENRFVSWRPRYYAYAFGQHRMLDGAGMPGDYVASGRTVSGTTNAILVRLDPSINTDIDGQLIRRVRRAPAISNENEDVFYSSFEVDLEPGLGAVASTWAGFTMAASTNGSVSGTITYGPPPVACEGAAVVITAQGLSTLSAADGTYSFASVAPGSVTVDVTKTGLTPNSGTDTVSAGANTVIDVILAPLP